jgi:hypothetical protein
MPKKGRDRVASMDATLLEEQKVPISKYEVDKIEEESSESDNSNGHHEKIEWTNKLATMSYHPLPRAVSVQNFKEKKVETKPTSLFKATEEDDDWLLYSEDFYYYFTKRITDEIQKVKSKS